MHFHMSLCILLPKNGKTSQFYVSSSNFSIPWQWKGAKARRSGDKSPSEGQKL